MDCRDDARLSRGSQCAGVHSGAAAAAPQPQAARRDPSVSGCRGPNGPRRDPTRITRVSRSRIHHPARDRVAPACNCSSGRATGPSAMKQRARRRAQRAMGCAQWRGQRPCRTLAACRYFSLQFSALTLAPQALQSAANTAHCHRACRACIRCRQYSSSFSVINSMCPCMR